MNFARDFMHSIGLVSPCETWKPGDVVEHPNLGPVTITSGAYWRNGRVSNFWYYQDAAGVEHHGYGWDPKP